MKKVLFIGVIAAVILAACSGAPSGGQTEEEAIAVARCLDEKGVEFFGAFWCPHCSDQKKMFGVAAEKYLPYRECDSRGENPVTERCLELKVERYPTWIFPDGQRLEGAIPLAKLQELSGCSGEELSKYFLIEQP